MSAERPRLRELAARRGIVDGYHDLRGTWRATSDATREALLAAMRLDASSEERCAQALAEIERCERERALAPICVWRAQAQALPRLDVRVPSGLGAPLRYELVLRHEDGHAFESDGVLGRTEPGARLRIALPHAPPEGRHAVRLRLVGSAGTHASEQDFVVAPRTAWSVREALGETRATGVWTNLWSVRSERGFGAGDLQHLGEIVAACAPRGLDFVGLPPLHALRHEGHAVSPYGPVSRLFRSVLTIDVEAVPELAEDAATRKHLASAKLQAALERLREGDRVPWDAVHAAKREVLGRLHRRFARTHRGRDTGRGRAFAQWCAERGALLDDFATFVVLQRLHGPDPSRWPASLRDPRSPEVAKLRDEHAELVDLERWLQFEAERQLATVAAGARAAGMRVGLYHDLAVGSGPDSFDAWAFADVIARGASVGAPPDDYSSTGQDWGLPPLDPWRSRETGHRFFSELLRATMRSAGALRIDHALGLLRTFWIPEGRPGDEGTYVMQPIDEWLGLVALESRRQRTLVIGEDLGTAPPELLPQLASWGVLSTRVLVFEREWDRFRAPPLWSARALATVSTHDLPPLAGWATGRDLVLRRELGQIPDDEALAGAKGAREHEVAALRSALVQEGVLAGDASTHDARTLVDAAHAFVARTPAPLVAFSLDDLAGEEEPVNLPGVAIERWPSWQRRMRTPLPAALAELARVEKPRG